MHKYMMFLENQDYLEHYGIRGMKWGVRRYQNPDGSRTDLGKQREREGISGPNNSNKKSFKSRASSGVKDVKQKIDHKRDMNTLRKMDPKHMTDEELVRAIERLERENRFRESSMSVGKRTVERMLVTFGISSAKSFGESLGKSLGTLKSKSKNKGKQRPQQTPQQQAKPRPQPTPTNNTNSTSSSSTTRHRRSDRYKNKRKWFKKG